MHEELVYNFDCTIIINVKYYLIYLMFINIDDIGFVIVAL